MAINMSSSFEDKVKKIRAGQARAGGGNWIKGEGLFEVEVLSTMRKMAFNKEQLQKGKQIRDKELFIVEFRVLSSSHPEHKPGSSASWTLVDPSDSGAGDLKGWCWAVAGADPRSLKDTDEEAQQQASLLALAAMGEAEAFAALEIPENYFVGKRLNLETKTVLKKNGDPFTKHVWSPAEAEE